MINILVDSLNIHTNRTMPVLASITSPITPTLNLGFVDFVPSASPITSPQPQTSSAIGTNSKSSPMQLSKLPPALSAREMSPSTNVEGSQDNGKQRTPNSFFSFN